MTLGQLGFQFRVFRLRSYARAALMPFILKIKPTMIWCNGKTQHLPIYVYIYVYYHMFGSPTDLEKNHVFFP